MEVSFLYLSISLFFLLLAFKFLSRAQRRRNLPPSPPAIPVIGHLHLLKHPFHRTLHRIGQKLGPVFSLQFGSRLVVVVSSPSAAEECFTKNDVVLANRPWLIFSKYLGYNNTTVATSPYGDHWRNLRRLLALEVLSTSRLNALLSIRQDEIRRLLSRLYRDSSSFSSRGFEKVEMKSKLSELTLNIVMRMIAGKRYYGDDLSNHEEAKEFRDVATEVFKYGGASYTGDFLPILRWIDYRSFQKNVRRIHKKMDSLVQGLIEEHRRDKSKNTMINHLLSLQESHPEYYTDTIVKGLILVSEFSPSQT